MNEDQPQIELFAQKLQGIEDMVRMHNHRGYDMTPKLNNASASFKDIMIGTKTIAVNVSENIQKALNDINDAGGGTVYITPGTHYVTQNLVMYSGTSLVGVSPVSSVIDFGLGAFGIQIVGTLIYSTGTVTVVNNATTVEGAGVTWTDTILGKDILLGGIFYTIASRTDADTLELAIPYAGEDLTTVSYVIATRNRKANIRDLTIQNTTGTAIKIQYADWTYMDNVSIIVSATPIDVDDADNITFTRTHSVYSIGSGQTINNGHFIKWDACGVIDITGVGIALTSCTNCSFLSDYILNATSDGMTMTDCDNIGIMNMAFTENGGQGIELISGNTNISMVNIGSFSNASDGVKLTATDDRNIIMGCILEDNGGWGINIAASTCDGNVVLNNVYNNNASGTLNDSGTGTIISGAETYIFVASNTLKASADTERNLTQNLYPAFTIKKEIQIFGAGTIRTKFDLKSDGACTAYGKIYINGIAIGTERSNATANYATHTEDFTIKSGDLIQLYISDDAGTNTAFLKNFRLYWDKNKITVDYVVNTD